MALKEEKVLVTSGEKKASVRKETNAVCGMRVTIMPKKTEHTAATLSEPSFSRGRGESKKKSIQGKSNHGASLSDNRAVNFPKTETGCKDGDKCLFPHDKVDEQPNQKPKKDYYTQKRRESDDKNAVAVVKIVPQFVCVLQDSNALVAQRGKQFRGNPMQKGLGSSRKVRFTHFYAMSSKYPEKKGPSLGKIQVKLQHQRSHSKQGLEHCQKHLQAQRKDKATFHSPRKNGYFPLHQQKRRRKESLW